MITAADVARYSDGFCLMTWREAGGRSTPLGHPGRSLADHIESKLNDAKGFDASRILLKTPAPVVGTDGVAFCSLVAYSDNEDEYPLRARLKVEAGDEV
jgi:hypothetical protein